MKRAPLVLLVLLLALHVWAVFARAGREPHLDETEYLHAAWMMANGERLYVTFFEHHSPFLFETLALFAPHGTGADVRPYFAQMHGLFGAVGLLALIAIAALVWQADRWAAPLTVALILATGDLWLRGFLDIRAESFALAFLFGGAVLVMRTRGALSGVGIGLVAISCLWMPKWPVACVVVGLFWLARERRPRAIVAALLTAGAGLAAIRLFVPFDLWWFFNVDVNRMLAQQMATSEGARGHFQGGVPFLYLPDAFRPLIVVPAALLVGSAAWMRRSAIRFLPVALFAASWIEIRFLYPWPLIWAHYYMMWVIASAAMLALVPSSIGIVLERFAVPAPRVRLATAAVLALAFVLTLPHVVAAATPVKSSATYWVSQKYLRERLRPGDEVWLETYRHPVSVRDAHYYWYLFGQTLSAADALRQTERGRRYLPPTDDLPPCHPSPRLRFTLHIPFGRPDVDRCIERLLANGRLHPTVFANVHEVRLKSPATQSD